MTNDSLSIISKSIQFDIGICRRYPGEKLRDGDPRWGQHTSGFMRETHSIKSLAQAITVDGYAISPVMRDYYRKSDNFISAQHLGLDRDEESWDSSIEGLLTDPFIADHAAIVHETASSTPDNPRSRVIFVLDQPITDPKHYRIVAEALIWKFQTADEQCKDPARFFYGRKNARHVVLGNILYGDALQEEIIEPYQQALKAKSNGAGAISGPSQGRNLGWKAVEFVANGAPIGDQRNRAVSAARSYLRAGYSVEDTAKALWRGFQASQQDPSDPWEWEHALFIAEDIERHPRPDMPRDTGESPSNSYSSNNLQWPDRPAADHESFHLTDQGNARRLVAQHGHDLRYCFPRKAWFAWDETKWANDITGEVYRRAKATVETIYSEAARQAEEDERKRTAKWAISSESHQRIEAMIDLARSESGIPVKQEEFDSNQWLSNCLNGTINLKTGELLPHQREHLITRMIPVTYDPNADCPLWLDFINDITDGNSEIAGFLQRAAGYSLTGETSEECLFINYGVGRNGKSVLLNTLMGIMGDYAVKVSPDLLMAFKGDQHPTMRATLVNHRLAVSQETAEGRRLDERMVKDLTSRDPINARFMHGNEFNFLPTHKLWVGT